MSDISTIYDLEYGKTVGVLSQDECTALKAYGHSPAKAAEIILDATRGDWFSRAWIDLVMGRHPRADND